MTKTAINKESGIETTEINVVRIFRRNSIIITIAKIAPKIALLSIVSTDFSIGAPWSNVEMISKSLYFSQDLLLYLLLHLQHQLYLHQRPSQFEFQLLLFHLFEK